MNLPGTVASAAPFAATITPQFLADTTLHLLSEEERLLPFGMRGFRECDVQFLLWRELVLRGYEAEMEVNKIDIVIHDKTNRVAAMELKGPWLAKDFGAGTYFPSLAKKDFEKLFGLISIGLEHCYSVWIWCGENEVQIERVFDSFLQHARTAAPGCLVESARSDLLGLDKHGDARWRMCRVYAVRVYKDDSRTAIA